MRKASNTYCNNYKLRDKCSLGSFNVLLLLIGTFLSGCDLIKIKGDNSDNDEQIGNLQRALTIRICIKMSLWE